MDLALDLPAIWKARGLSPERDCGTQSPVFVCEHTLLGRGAKGGSATCLDLGAALFATTFFIPVVTQCLFQRRDPPHVCKDLILTSKHMVSIAAFCCGQNTGFLGVNLLQGIALRHDEVAKDRAS